MLVHRDHPRLIPCWLVYIPWIRNSGASTATEMLKMDPEAKLPWAIKMVNLTENVKNLNEDESAEAGFLI